MMVRGTASLDGTQIAETADRIGGSIDAYGDADFSEIAATALDRYWKEMLGLVADVALRPSLPDGTVQAVRDFLVRQIRNRAEKPFTVALDALLAREFGDNPYAWDPIGLKDSLERVDRAALLAHYRRHYVPAGMVLAVSGKVKTAEVLAEVERLFGAVPRARCPRRTRRRPPRPRATRDVVHGSRRPGSDLHGGRGARDDRRRLRRHEGGGDGARRRPRRALLLRAARQAGAGLHDRRPGADAGGHRLLPGPARHRAGEQGEGGGSIAGAAQAHPARAGRRRGAARGQGVPARQPRHGPPHQCAASLVLASLEVAGVGHEYLDRYTAQVRAATAGDVQRAARRYLETVRTVVAEPPPK